MDSFQFAAFFTIPKLQHTLNMPSYHNSNKCIHYMVAINFDESRCILYALNLFLIFGTGRPLNPCMQVRKFQIT